jgi:hypothetical protein
VELTLHRAKPSDGRYNRAMRIRVPKTRLVLSGRRLALLCVVWVVLGAGLNVGVAWVCALGLVPLPPTGQPGRVSMVEWPIDVPGPWPEAPRGDLVHVYQPRAEGFGHYRMTWVYNPRGADDVEENVAYAVTGRRSGWPLPALASYEAWRVWDEPDGQRVGESRRLGLIRSGINLGADPLASRVVPLKPVWRGFIANLCLYAPLVAVAWIYGFVWPATALRERRQRRRWRRDRCLSCGCDLSGLMPGRLCPECGREKPWPDPSSFLHDQ